MTELNGKKDVIQIIKGMITKMEKHPEIHRLEQPILEGDLKNAEKVKITIICEKITNP